MASVEGFRRGLESTRFGWYVLGILLAVPFPLFLDEFGLVPGVLLIGLVVLLALEMSRPLLPVPRQDRTASSILYVLLLGPILVAAAVLVWTGIGGKELTLDFADNAARDRAFAWTLGPPVAAILVAGGLLLARRGTRREKTIYVATIVAAGPLALLWNAWLEGPFFNVPGIVFIDLGALLAFGLMSFRILWPRRVQRARSLHLYDPSKA